MVVAVFLVALAFVGCRNKPPKTPFRPIGPDSAGTYDSTIYRSVSTDPNRDDIQYIFDWDNGDFDTTALFGSGDTASAAVVWTDTGWYGVRVRARDEKGNFSAAWSDTHMVHVFVGANRRPYRPAMPTGPDSGWVEEWQVFSTSALDPNNDSVKITFIWDDGQVSVVHAPVPSGTTVIDSVKYHSGGIKRVRAVAQDMAGLVSDTSEAKSFKALQGNTAPDAPTMGGPHKGIANGPFYRFYATASDPQGNRVQYKFFFDGDTTRGWTPFRTSGTAGMDSFRPATLGTHQVRAIARDSLGAVSETSSARSFEVVDEAVVLWSISGADYVASPALGPLAGSGEQRPGVIVGDLDGYLHGVDAYQGEELMYVASSLDPEGLSASPTIGAGGTIYNGCDNGQMIAFNNDGAVRWRFPDTVTSADYNATAILDGSVLYVGGEDMNLRKLQDNDSSVTHLWGYYFGEDVNSSPALMPNGNLVVCDDSGYISCLNPDGAFQWRYATGAGIVSSPAIGPDGTVYVGTDQGEFLALKDGTPFWTYQIPPPNNVISSSPAIDGDGNVYFGVDNGVLYKLNSSGNPVWSYTVSSADLSSSPALSQDGVIYIGAEDEKLYAINPDGTERWSVALSSALGGRRHGQQKLSLTIFPSPVIDQWGIIYIASSTGIHAVSGRLAGTLLASPWPMFHHDVRHTGKYGSW
jgi:outer membrane protein assembly factor BamB